jgi:hypothetical protein
MYCWVEELHFFFVGGGVAGAGSSFFFVGGGVAGAGSLGGAGLVT